MKTSDKGLIALIGHEGVVPGPYFDSVGVQTYGVGHTAAAGAPDPATLRAGMPADLDAELKRVFAVFKDDIARYEADVARAIKVPVTQAQFDAAVSFHYNTGAIGKATWVKKLNAGDVVGAGDAIMNWVKPPEIKERREDEQNLFRTGEYPNNLLTVWGVSEQRRVIWKRVRTLTASEALAMMGGRVTHQDPQEAGGGIWAAIIAAILSIFGGRK